MATKRRATTARLEPGQNSIDRAVPFETPTGWGVQWSLRLPDGSVVRKKTTADTVGAVRARAHRLAEALLRADGAGGEPGGGGGQPDRFVEDLDERGPLDVNGREPDIDLRRAAAGAGGESDDLSTTGSTTKKKNRASTSKLEPGQHTIDRAIPFKTPAGWGIQWSVRLTDGRVVRRKSMAGTAGAARARARQKAEDLLITDGVVEGPWKRSSKLSKFIDKVAVSAIAEADLRSSTRYRYTGVIVILLGRCEGHAHKHSLSDHTIATGIKYLPMEDCLREIAEIHGRVTARVARTVLGAYICTPLRQRGLIEFNPLAGQRLPFIKKTKDEAAKAASRRALTVAEQLAVIDWLLALDPAAGVARRSVAKRERVITLTLLQASTGLRVSEAASLRWEDVVDDGGELYVPVYADLAKTHRARNVGVLHPGVRDYLKARRAAAGSLEEFIVGGPADPAKQWSQSDRAHACAAFYKEMRDVLGIDVFDTERTHVWRSAINNLTKEEVAVAVRADFLGHDPETNKASYTRPGDTSTMIAAYRRIMSTATGETVSGSQETVSGSQETGNDSQNDSKKPENRALSMGDLGMITHDEMTPDYVI